MYLILFVIFAIVLAVASPKTLVVAPLVGAAIFLAGAFSVRDIRHYFAQTQGQPSEPALARRAAISVACLAGALLALMALYGFAGT